MLFKLGTDPNCIIRSTERNIEYIREEIKKRDSVVNYFIDEDLDEIKIEPIDWDEHFDIKFDSLDYKIIHTAKEWDAIYQDHTGIIAQSEF